MRRKHSFLDTLPPQNEEIPVVVKSLKYMKLLQASLHAVSDGNSMVINRSSLEVELPNPNAQLVCPGQIIVRVYDDYTVEYEVPFQTQDLTPFYQLVEA